MDTPQDILERELMEGETLLWTGVAPGGLRLTAHDIYLIPFSILWGGFAIGWETLVVAKGGPWFFELWGVPFVAVGIYMIIGRFFYDAAARQATVYGVTSDRIIIVSGIVRRKIRSIDLATLSQLSIVDRGDGATITFGPINPMAGWYTNGFPGSSAMATPAFELAYDGRKVYEVIQAARKQCRQRGG